MNNQWDMTLIRRARQLVVFTKCFGSMILLPSERGVPDIYGDKTYKLVLQAPAWGY